MSAIVTLTMNPALDIATATDEVVPTRKLRCDAPRYDPGGGGINVARAVHALGGDAFAVFPVGGLSGEMLCRLLDAEGVSYAAVAVPGVTRESLAVVEAKSGKQYRFLLPGPQIGATEQQLCLDALVSRLAGARYLVASGSLPPGVPEDFYAKVGAIARQHDLRFVLDTSGPALAHAGPDVFLLKTSLHELEDLAGTKLQTAAEQERAARKILAQGRAENLVLSLGDQGAVLATLAGTQRFTAIEVEAVGSVGAGDSMLAGIVLSLTRGHSLIGAVGFGMAAGAAALLQPGTELCRREDVERLYRSLVGAEPQTQSCAESVLSVKYG